MLELTAENAADFLRGRGLLEAGPARVEELGWGVSNVVLRVTTPERRFAVKQSRPQLRTRAAWFSNIDRVFREVEAMRLLGPLLPPLTVPEIFFEDRENYLFGMSHAPDDAVVWKECLLAGDVRPEVAHHAGVVLGLIHERTANRPELVERFAERTVFRQLRIEPFYLRIRERHPDLADAGNALIAEMEERSDALCHGDFSPKNLLVHASPLAPLGRGVGGEGAFTLVDYETAHLGDPTMDLGFFLSHLVLKALKHYPQGPHDQLFDLTGRFLQGYASVIRFQPLAALVSRAVPHFAACALARVDGTSPVEYLPEARKQEAVRRIAQRVLLEKPLRWDEVLEHIRTCLPTLTVS